MVDASTNRMTHREKELEEDLLQTRRDLDACKSSNEVFNQRDAEQVKVIKELRANVLELTSRNESQCISIAQLQAEIENLRRINGDVADLVVKAENERDDMQTALREVLKQIARGLAWKE